jgi:hypothetical protein
MIRLHTAPPAEYPFEYSPPATPGAQNTPPHPPADCLGHVNVPQKLTAQGKGRAVQNGFFVPFGTVGNRLWEMGTGKWGLEDFDGLGAFGLEMQGNA